jgi:ABC-type transport system involved in Fe-S cluster assembly fused permease/ATPase subunit
MPKAHQLTIQVFWPYLWPTNRPRLLVNMAGVAVCLLGERALNIFGPRQFGILVNALSAGLVGPSFGSLALYILFDFLNSYSGLRGLRNGLWIPVEANARVRLDTKSYNHVMELSCDFHDNKEDGKLYAAIRQGYAVTSLLETLLYELAPMIMDLVLALVYFRILFDSYLVLIAAATMLVYMLSAVHFTNYQASLQRNMNALSRQKWHYQYETMGKWSTVAYYNRIPHVEGMYGTTASIWSGIWQKTRWVSLGGSAAQNTILDMGCFAALTFAAYQVVINGKDIGSFMTLVTYWSKFTGPIANLSSTHREIMSDLVDAEELRALFEKKASVVGGDKELAVSHGQVTFENISFSYDGKSTIIDDLSLQVSPGQTIAFIGETGAGKSTLLKLLFRFYDPTQGSIKIDGQDIRDVTLDSLREYIGVVPQEPVLFNESIMSNLRFGKLDVTEEEAIAACQAAAIHERIEKFADGYDSFVGDRGIKLSGGERQRVAIARTMLKDPKIIILDEATSSVDNETEELIQTGLAKLCAGRTTFVIAHRLSTIMNADLIVVIKDGKILEQGSSRELFKRKGKYYSLWSKQMGIIDALTKEDEVDTPPESILERSSEQGNDGDNQPGKNTISSRAANPTHPRGSSGQSTGSGQTGHSSLRPEASEFVPKERIKSGCSDPQV